MLGMRPARGTVNMHRPRKRKIRRLGSRLTLEPLESRAMLHAAAVLSGSVYFDADSDGSRGTSEIGVPGVVIRLSESDSPDSSLARSAAKPASPSLLWTMHVNCSLFCWPQSQHHCCAMPTDKLP